MGFGGSCSYVYVHDISARGNIRLKSTKQSPAHLPLARMVSEELGELQDELPCLDAFSALWDVVSNNPNFLRTSRPLSHSHDIQVTSATSDRSMLRGGRGVVMSDIVYNALIRFTVPLLLRTCTPSMSVLSLSTDTLCGATLTSLHTGYPRCKTDGVNRGDSF
jgi:hypothetical protein